jgi:hypothetical protein
VTPRDRAIARYEAALQLIRLSDELRTFQRAAALGLPLADDATIAHLAYALRWAEADFEINRPRKADRPHRVERGSRP